jgi:hypothetical protein
MPGSPATMADTLPTSKSPKLRASCEGCGTAKVRCDRGQPKCSRCVALGLTCVYGISRKFGKPPRKRPSACLDVSSGFSYAKRVTRRAQSCENHITMGLEQTQSINKPAQPQLSSSDSQTDTLPLPSGPNSTASIQSYDNRTTMGAIRSQTVKEAAQLKSSDLATEVLLLPSHISNMSSIYEQNQLGSNFITPLPLDEWAQFDIWGPSLEFPSFPNDSRLPDSASEPVNNLSANFDSPESHSRPVCQMIRLD